MRWRCGGGGGGGGRDGGEASLGDRRERTEERTGRKMRERASEGLVNGDDSVGKGEAALGREVHPRRTTRQTQR